MRDEVTAVVGKLLVMLVVAASCVHAIGTAFAQDKIRIAWAGASPANAAVWVLQEKKLLQKYGADTDAFPTNKTYILKRRKTKSDSKGESP